MSKAEQIVMDLLDTAKETAVRVYNSEALTSFNQTFGGIYEEPDEVDAFMETVGVDVE